MCAVQVTKFVMVELIGVLFSSAITRSVDMNIAAHIYYLIFSVREESRHGLVGASGSAFLTRLQSKCWPELPSHLKTGERLTSEFSWLSTVKFFVG